MKQLKKLKFLFFLFVMFFVSACDDDVVGKWDPMQWEYKNVSEGIKIVKPSGKDKEHARYSVEIEVAKSGSLDIVCKNYKSFWFEEYPEINYEGDYSTQFTSEYCNMKIEGNTIHCEFSNIERSPSAEFPVVVTAGDIFFRFLIEIK